MNEIINTKTSHIKDLHFILDVSVIYVNIQYIQNTFPFIHRHTHTHTFFLLVLECIKHIPTSGPLYLFHLTLLRVLLKHHFLRDPFSYHPFQESIFHVFLTLLLYYSSWYMHHKIAYYLLTLISHQDVFSVHHHIPSH